MYPSYSTPSYHCLDSLHSSYSQEFQPTRYEFHFESPLPPYPHLLSQFSLSSPHTLLAPIGLRLNSHFICSFSFKHHPYLTVTNHVQDKHSPQMGRAAAAFGTFDSNTSAGSTHSTATDRPDCSSLSLQPCIPETTSFSSFPSSSEHRCSPCPVYSCLYKKRDTFCIKLAIDGLIIMRFPFRFFPANIPSHNLFMILVLEVQTGKKSYQGVDNKR